MNLKKIKDSELGFEDSDVKISVVVGLDETLFEANYEEDLNSGEYDLSESIPWEKVSTILEKVDGQLSSMLPNYFETNYCTYYYDDNNTIFDMSVKESVLMKKLSDELPVEDIDEGYESLIFTLLNNNNDLNVLFGDSVYDFLLKTYPEENEKFLSDIVEACFHSITLYVDEPSESFKRFVEETF